MVIEPRSVAPGFTRRWSREALELMGRSFHTWFAVAVVLSLSIWALPGSALLSVPLGLLFYCVSTEIAAVSDQRVLRVTELPGIFQVALQECVRDLYAKRWVLLVSVALIAAAHLWVQAQPVQGPAASPAPVDLADPLTWVFGSLLGKESPFISGAISLWAGAALQGRSAYALSSLVYPLRRTFGLQDEDQLSALTSKAMRRNPTVALLLGPVQVAVVIFTALALPILGPFLMCFLPAVSYVAFREVFVDDGGNREQVSERKRSLANQGGAASTTPP